MAGLPDIDTLSTYGGAKEDYAPVEDASTDLSASHWNLLAMSVAGVTQTACRAWCTFVGHGTTPTDPSSNVHGSVWGNVLGVKPVVARTGGGIYTITWPTSITDELGQSHSVALRRSWGSAEGPAAFIVTTTMTSSNIITLRVFDAAGAGNDGVGTAFTVFAI
jgi:hypothetical protein